MRKKTALIVTALFVLLGASLAQCARAAEAEWFIMPLAHGSDPSDAGDSDPTFDFAGGGATVKAQRWEVDIAVGRKAIACRFSGRCRSTPSGFVAVKWYPGRKK